VPGAARSGASTLLRFRLLLFQNLLQAFSQEGSRSFMRFTLLHVPGLVRLLLLFFLLLLFLVYL
jgi:hypothetical protein